MRIFKLLAILGIFSWIFHQCTRGKKKSDGIEGFLEKEFPGRFTVLETSLADPIRNMSFKVKNSIVAEKSDTLIQIKVRWDKRDEGLGLKKAEIEGMFEAARKNVSEARAVLGALKSQGLKDISVGVFNGAIIVLFFEEALPGKRRESLAAVGKAFRERPASEDYSLSLHFMEPAFQHKEFEEIVPLGFWARPDGLRDKNTLMSIQADNANPDFSKMENKWKLNSGSERFFKALEEGRPLAEKWAENRIKKPWSFLSTSQVEALDKNLAIRIQYAYTQAAQATDSSETHGFIECTWHFDDGRFDDFAVRKEAAN